MTFPYHLSEGGLDPVKEIDVQSIMYQQGEGASKELGGNIGNGGVFTQVIHPTNKLGGDEADTLCLYLTGEIIRFG